MNIQTNLRPVNRLFAGALGLAAGVLAATLLQPSSASAVTCDWNLCSQESGNCFPVSSAKWDCWETQGGCDDAPCGLQ